MMEKSKNEYYILQDTESKGVLQLRVFLWRSDVANAIISDFKKTNNSFCALEKCIRNYRTVYMGKMGEQPKRILLKSHEYRKIIKMIKFQWYEER